MEQKESLSNALLKLNRCLEEQAFNKKKDLFEKVFAKKLVLSMEATVKTAEHVVAFVDIGTNAVRLLVVRINPNFSYTIISQEKEVVRLGEQEFKDNILKPEAMERAIFVCGKFADLAKTYGATEIIAVGTSAIREARNQSEFLQKLLQGNRTERASDFGRRRSPVNLSRRIKWNRYR